LPVLANCVAQVRAAGVERAGDFSVKPVAAAATETPGAAKPARSGGSNGTGFVISANSHVVTNHHVIKGCTGDILGNLSGDAPVKLRLVSSDESNDLALLQASDASFKTVATIRDKTVRPGDAVVAIGYPYHGLLTSDFTVTTGIVSSLAGILNNTRFLQISAAVQPGNSGGPLLDNAGLVVGVVSGKLNALSMARVTGNIPENINFAIKTGALRDFLDNSAVPYQTAESRNDSKTAEIARDARTYTLFLSCTTGEQADAGKKQATAKK
jgi:S1-C subfamily serine protease